MFFKRFGANRLDLGLEIAFRFLIEIGKAKAFD